VGIAQFDGKIALPGSALEFLHFREG